MTTAHARYYVLDLFLLLILFLFIRGHVCADDQVIKQRMLQLSHNLLIDAIRKGDAIWMYRKAYQKYISYSVGERVYVIRAKFAQMLRSLLRNQMMYGSTSSQDLIKNALMMQKKAQILYHLKDELIEIDDIVSNSENPTNATRYGDHACQVAGPPCEIPLQNQKYGLRRSASSKNYGSLDQALELLDAKRDYVVKTYQKETIRPPLDIAAELNRTLMLTAFLVSNNHARNDDYVNFAPDL